MKNILFASIITAIVLLFLLSATAGGAVALDRLRDRIPYDTLAEKVFAGAVHDKPTLFEGRMYFTLWTSSGAFAVEIGPKEFVERNGCKLRAGQTVTVVGMPIVLGNREMILAREITIGDSVFRVRDRNGNPMWDMDRPVQMDPEVADGGNPVC
jgi:hypothetical protein